MTQIRHRFRLSRPLASDPTALPAGCTGVAAGPKPFDATTTWAPSAASLLGALALGERRRGGAAAVRPEASGDLDTFLTVCDAESAFTARALDGWVVIATPDAARWGAFCTTYLTLALWHRYNAATAWEADEVRHLAMLVLGTHPAHDIAGTAASVGIPALARLDDAPGSVRGAGLDYLLVTRDG